MCLRRGLNVSKKQADSAVSFVPTSVAGIPVVTIPLAEYEDLLQLRRRIAELSPPALAPLPRSPIEVNHEISTFIDARLGKMFISEIAKACRQEFGDRAPSKSAIHRYWQRRRDVNSA
jgi:hypothetical protein